MSGFIDVYQFASIVDDAERVKFGPIHITT